MNILIVKTDEEILKGCESLTEDQKKKIVSFEKGLTATEWNREFCGEIPEGWEEVK